LGLERPNQFIPKFKMINGIGAQIISLAQNCNPFAKYVFQNDCISGQCNTFVCSPPVQAFKSISGCPACKRVDGTKITQYP